MSPFWTTQELSHKIPLKSRNRGLFSQRVLLLLLLDNSYKQEKLQPVLCASPSMFPSQITPSLTREMYLLQSRSPATGQNIGALEIRVRVPPSHQGGVIGVNCWQTNRGGGGDGDWKLIKASHFSMAGSSGAAATPQN